MSSALGGLANSTRQRAGLRGGVTKLTYVSSFIVLEGTSLLDTLGGLPDERVFDDVRITVLVSTLMACLIALQWMGMSTLRQT